MNINLAVGPPSAKTVCVRVAARFAHFVQIATSSARTLRSDGRSARGKGAVSTRAPETRKSRQEPDLAPAFASAGRRQVWAAVRQHGWRQPRELEQRSG